MERPGSTARESVRSQRRLAVPLAITSLCGLVALGCLATTQRITLSEASRHSSPAEFSDRRGIPVLDSAQEALEYDLSVQTFELYAPKTTQNAASRHGLVWVSPGRSGAPPSTWAPVLDRHRVIWIGANDAGNRRSPADRIHLALDAAAHLLRLLGSDEQRVYIGGFSGGARIASEIALLYPDIFSGGFYAGAADYFRFVRSSDPRWSAWEPTFPPPKPMHLQLARSVRRFVFLTGSRDYNRALVRDVHRAYVADGFSSAALLEVPELTHALPSARCFERALVELLSPDPPVPVHLSTTCE